MNFNIRPIVIIWFLFVSISVLAQSLAEIPLKTRFADFDVFNVGDSLLVTYLELIDGKQTTKASWVSADGSISPYNLLGLETSNIIKIARKGNELELHFLKKEKGKMILKTNGINISTNSRREIGSEILLEGYVVASFMENNLNVVCYDDFNKALKFYVIGEGKMLKKHEIHIGMLSKIFDKSKLEYYEGGNISTTNPGIAKVKIIKDQKILYILIDGTKESAIYRIDLGDYSFRLFSLAHTFDTKFNTFVTNDVVYRVFNQKNDSTAVQLEIFNLNPFQKFPTVRYAYTNQEPYKSFSRTGEKHEVKKLKAFYTVTDAFEFAEPNWTIMVSNGISVNSIRIGIYKRSKSGFHVTNPVSFLTSVAIRTLVDGPGISRYFYLTESKDHRIITDMIDLISSSPAQRADEYEIRLEDNEKVLYKGYKTFKNDLIGIYGLRKSLFLVRFKK